MKIKPELVITNKQDLPYKSILVTGSDEVYINYVTNFIINKFKTKNYYIDRSGEVNQNLNGSLFTDNKVLFVIKKYSTKKELFLGSTHLNSVVLICSINNKKLNSLKSDFLKSKDMLLLECYQLNRGAKELIIKNYLDEKKIEVSRNVFWYLLDNLENGFVFLRNQLKTISLLNKKIDSISLVEETLVIDNKVEINKIFFYIFKQNKDLLKIYKSNIYSSVDFYKLLNSLKVYLGIISECSTKNEALLKFPRYLFAEKDIFINIYNKLDSVKITKIYNNILKVEMLVRKNSNLYFEIGFRFLINTKQIIIS